MAFRFFPQNYQFTDDDGTLLAGGFVYFYTSETSSPKDTFTTSGLSTPNENPMELDSAARLQADCWGSGVYRVIVKDSLGATVGDTLDNVTFADIETSNYMDLTTDQTADGVKTFTESPQVPTATAGDSSANAASTEFVNTALSSNWSTGDVKLTLKTTADSGWIMCNDGTIGNASSGGTTRANADTADLFSLLWTNVSDTYAAVSSGRGASASADFAANKTIALTKMLGRALAVAGSGASLTARTLGQTLGTETHTLTADELPSHTHSVPLGIDGSGGDHNNSGSATFANTGSGITTGSAGTGAAHNNMPPVSFLNAMIKL